jgi:uncharacterized protein
MSLKLQLTEDMKQAMRDRASLKLNTIRFLLSEIKNAELDSGDLDDAAAQKIAAKQIKSMKDAIEEYKKGDRNDLVSEEEEKIAVLEAYLPKQMSDEELMKAVEEVKASSGITEMGPLIGAVKQKVGNQADGGRVAAMIKQSM